MTLTERQEQRRKELHTKFRHSCRTEHRDGYVWPWVAEVHLQMVDPKGTKWDYLPVPQEFTTFWFFSTEEDLKKFEELTRE